jgi:ATP-dependent exoDNAse (exonuclease V) beta subunit
MIQIMKASAGSGKTFSLARKYISLLLQSKDRHAYRHILAVTFTNKATDEMKSRILKELHIMASDPISSDYLDWFVPSVFPSASDMQKKAEAVLRDILHDYSAFAVSTIDRFFQQTLKAFSREIGHFASYQVELDKDSLVAESVDRILDSLTEADGSLLAWLTDNVLEQIEQGGRYSMDANLLDMAKRLKSSQRQEVLESAGIDADQDYSKDRLLEIRRRCREIITVFRNEAKARADKALAILHEAGVNPAESRNKFMNELYVYSELTETDHVPRPKDTFFKNASDSDLWFAKTKAKTLLPLVYPFLEAPLNDFCDLFGKEFDVYNTACILDGQLYGLGVAGELSHTFNELMKEKNVLCIDDSNTILRDIIDGSDAPFVYEKIGVRYDHYLLDEFQDTARVQWQNFSPLLKESESKGGDNLIVGDVKQSIYRWRGSDWKLLQESIPAEFPSHTQTVLDTNYRSLSNIIEFNNAFFKKAASILDSIAGHEDQGPMSKIYFDVHQNVSKSRSDKDPGNVSFTFCPKEEELEKVMDSVLQAQEAGARLSEIAVLVRSNHAGEAVAKHLIDNGIAVVTDDSLKVKSSITVRRIVSLMSLADNPEDTVNGYLAQSLDVQMPRSCSSLVDMAESLLRSLKAGDSEEAWKGEILHIQSFMDALQDYVNSNGNSLRGFLKCWEGEDPSISSPSSGESVRIMTIHKSKGLAFPYVIIPFVENIILYKPDKHWCMPELEGTSLEGLAEGVYDVSLGSDSVNTLFAEDYRKENFLQQVDNMNILYVAMTRPALGVHLISALPPAKCIQAVEEGKMPEFKNFSQILYWFLSSDKSVGAVRTDDEESFRFDLGNIVDFNKFRKSKKDGLQDFEMAPGNEYPSISLNIGDGDPQADVRERGRLKYTADSIDFFSEEGEAGISASNRIKGVVLHDILSRIIVAEDLEKSVRQSLDCGDISEDEYAPVLSLLRDRLEEIRPYGWFDCQAIEVMNETTLIDKKGNMCRPDRILMKDGKVIIIDYKFGEHYHGYEKQVKFYADIWKEMGYQDVSAFLWYVQTGEIKAVL